MRRRQAASPAARLPLPPPPPLVASLLVPPHLLLLLLLMLQMEFLPPHQYGFPAAACAASERAVMGKQHFGAGGAGGRHAPSRPVLGLVARHPGIIQCQFHLWVVLAHDVELAAALDDAAGLAQLLDGSLHFHGCCRGQLQLNSVEEAHSWSACKRCTMQTFVRSSSLAVLLAVKFALQEYLDITDHCNPCKPRRG